MKGLGKKELTFHEKAFMVVLFGMLFAAIAIYKATQTQLIPLIILAAMCGCFAADAFWQINQPQYKRVAKRYGAIGIISVGAALVLIFFAIRPLIV